ncbi:iron-containing alcohol dehydrogenase [Neptunicella marina]|uniref:Iron-containing alcohol dehydrogenase n=1 Tax=Neptunicella marina TaxID=2125989 RepID=A0A8J6M364_9ALTE|nr:iron-containing alcohol dehydrogenase [Neptunicella marina]MBC3765111.1 iron-containing alcohol dehydrogenase [Neptunicella marina]
MQDFIFHNPTKVAFGKNSIQQLATLLPKDSKVLLLYGGGSIKKNGVYDTVMQQLTTHEVVEFGGIEANPEYTTLMKAVELVKQHHIDFLLAVGGGSVVDGTKFVAAAAEFDGEPWDILAKGVEVKSAVPLGCVLTLPATGSETNIASVVNRSELGKKLSFLSEHVRPQFAVLDPQTTYSLPDRQLANGVVDAFVHVMEQYLTYPVNATVQDRFAEGILQNLIELGPRVFEKDNYEVRANLMWNATQALNGLIGAGVPQDWATHQIGHELTALYGLDHAVTLAIVLPQMMRHQRSDKREKLLQYASRVWHLDTSDEEAAIDQAIVKTEQFFQQMGMKIYLHEHNVEETVVRLVPRKLMENGMMSFGERGNLTPKDAELIIKAAL